jgi:predicted nucleic acid-binding protein
MVILDTNVVSETMRPIPDQAVIAWLDRQAEASIWITSVTVLEIRTGIEVLPPSRRRLALSVDFERFLDSEIRGRVMAFDTEAARTAAKLTADRQRSGRPGDLRDSMIAGIAIATGASLATRNMRHFDDLPIALIDPWTA